MCGGDEMPCKYPLSDIKQLAKDGLVNIAEDKVWFSAPKKSFTKVIETFQANGQKFLNVQQAKEYILNKIIELTDADFCMQSFKREWGIVVDIYGSRMDNINWYIKFCIEDGALHEISFHPLVDDMILENGVKLKKEKELQ